MSPWTTEFENLLRRHCHFVTPEEPIDPDAPFATLGVDSLSFLALIVEIDAEFAITVPDTVLIEENDTPRGLWRLVSGLPQGQPGGVP